MIKEIVTKPKKINKRLKVSSTNVEKVNGKKLICLTKIDNVHVGTNTNVQGHIFKTMEDIYPLVYEKYQY